MVNLITPKGRSALYTLYFLRLLSVSTSTLAVIMIAIMVLLSPTYFSIHAEADQAQEYVTTASDIATQRAKSQSPETLQRFHESVTLLTRAARAPSFSHILALTTQDLPRGVTISHVGVTYTEAGNAAVTIEGNASTRAELIAYSNALKKTPELSAVQVPVSALVADVDSDFTLSAAWTKP